MDMPDLDELTALFDTDHVISLKHSSERQIDASFLYVHLHSDDNDDKDGDDDDDDGDSNDNDDGDCDDNYDGRQLIFFY